MLEQPPDTDLIVEFPLDERPRLLVVVDTEEEFPWNLPHSRENISVAAMADIGLGQERFDRYGVRPTYVIDYPVASQSKGYEPLQEIAAAGRCTIGAHLHPWVTPPNTEPVNPHNSFPGNLEQDLEKQKLSVLTEAIASHFDTPTVYKAGRYGVGPHSAAILAELGYNVDLSPTPAYSYVSEGGPDFTSHPCSPYWFEAGERLCIPCTGAFIGAARRYGRQLYPWLTHPVANRLRAGGIASRLGLLERIRLSPEGFSLRDMIRLTDYLFHVAGVRTFTLSYHSPSLRAGCTPYVNTSSELDGFLAAIEGYLAYFFERLNGVAAVPGEIKAELSRLGPGPSAKH